MKAVIFTYEPDQELAALASRALEMCGVQVLLVWDKYIPALAPEKIPEAEHVASTFSRGRNLNGPEAVRSVLSHMVDAGLDQDWVLKVDSDTIVRPEFIRRLRTSKNDGEGFYCPGVRPWWGACYAFRPAGLRMLAKLAQTSNRMVPRCAEDLTIHGLAVDLRGTLNAGLLEWHRYGKTNRIFHEGGEAAHYGDLRDIPKPHFTVAARKKYVAERMREDRVFRT